MVTVHTPTEEANGYKAKFDKLSELYASMRNDHIVLLQQKKQFQAAQASQAKAAQAVEQLQKVRATGQKLERACTWGRSTPRACTDRIDDTPGAPNRRRRAQACRGAAAGGPPADRAGTAPHPTSDHGLWMSVLTNASVWAARCTDAEAGGGAPEASARGQQRPRRNAQHGPLLRPGHTCRALWPVTRSFRCTRLRPHLSPRHPRSLFFLLSSFFVSSFFPRRQSQGAEVETLVRKFNEEKAALEAEREAKIAEVAQIRTQIEQERAQMRQSISVRPSPSITNRARFPVSGRSR